MSAYSVLLSAFYASWGSLQVHHDIDFTMVDLGLFDCELSLELFLVADGKDVL